jgi:hypothetical protein
MRICLFTGQDQLFAVATLVSLLLSGQVHDMLPYLFYTISEQNFVQNLWNQKFWSKFKMIWRQDFEIGLVYDIILKDRIVKPFL